MYVLHESGMLSGKFMITRSTGLPKIMVTNLDGSFCNATWDWTVFMKRCLSIRSVLLYALGCANLWPGIGRAADKQMGGDFVDSPVCFAACCRLACSSDVTVQCWSTLPPESFAMCAFTTEVAVAPGL